MEFNRNPFRYGADFGRDDTVDGKEQIAYIESVIRDGQRLFLIDLRGLGKTSILRAARANLFREGAFVL